MSELAYSSASQLARLIRAGAVSSRELTELYISRIERYDGDINAVVVRDFDNALASADAADDALAKGEAAGPLHGVPMTIKESYNIAGLPTTFGQPAQAQNIATDDADVVKRFRRLGRTSWARPMCPSTSLTCSHTTKSTGPPRIRGIWSAHREDPRVVPQPRLPPHSVVWTAVRISVGPFVTPRINAASTATSLHGTSCLLMATGCRVPTRQMICLLSGRWPVAAKTWRWQWM